MPDVRSAPLHPDSAVGETRGAVRAALMSVVVLVVALGLLVGLSMTNQPGPSDETTSSAATTRSADPAPLRSLPRRAAQDGRALGPTDAPVVLVLYSNYRCATCGYVGREVLPALEREYVAAGELRIEWRDHPEGGRSAWLAARAGWAAGRQDVFWEFHDQLQARAQSLGGDSWDVAALTEVAASVGMDTAQFRRDLASDRALRAVQRDLAQSQRVGVTEAPVLVVEGEAYSGNVPLEKLQRVIARARRDTADR